MADNQYQLQGNAPQLFERDNAQTLGSPLAARVFDHVELQPGDRVLDAACGTGIVTRVAARRFPQVGRFVGLDRNAGMLEVARANTPTNIPVEWQQGDLTSLPFPDRSFEAVLCQNGLQFVRDKSIVLREMHRVLVAQGQLALTVWSRVFPYAAALSKALARHISAESAASNDAMFQLRDAGTVRSLVEEAGFREITMRELLVVRPMPASPEGVVADTARTAFARDVAAAGEAARQALGREVSTALKEYRDGDHLAIPHWSHLVQARAA